MSDDDTPTARFEIASLKEHFELRLGGMEKCIERITTAIEKLTESRERVIVLETLGAASNRRLEALEVSKAKLWERIDEVRMSTIRLSVYAMIAIGSLGVAAPVLLKKVFGVE